MSSPQRTGGRHSKALWIVPLVILGVLLAAYLGGVVAFSQFFFMPGTTLDGQDVSLRTVDQVAAEKAGALGDYEAHVTGDGVDVEVRASDISLAYDGEAYAREAIGQTNAWAWPVELATGARRTVSAESAVVFDRDALLSLFQPSIDAASQRVKELGGDAVSYDAEQGAFVLDSGVAASYLDADALVDALSRAFTDRAASIELGADELAHTDDALHAALDAANAYLAAAGSALALDGQEARAVTADDIAGWVSVGDDLTVSLDQDAVGAWVNEAVGSLNTVGSERTYTRPDGKQVTVSGGSYGWEVDEGSATTSLVDALNAHEARQVDVPYSQSGQVAPDDGGRDWGSRYIDIDLTEQHVRMYDDSGALIWESDCVSGDHSQGYDTPTGVNQVNSNMATGDVQLRGLDYNGDGEPDYISHVKYWIPFVGNLVALHDANWRSSFGGSIYQYNGSHGCVNLPVDKAAELYNLVKLGDVVVVHY
ncbi:L,D-transpeptidase family protein [Thermophilibacter sp.]